MTAKERPYWMHTSHEPGLPILLHEVVKKRSLARIPRHNHANAMPYSFLQRLTVLLGFVSCVLAKNNDRNNYNLERGIVDMTSTSTTQTIIESILHDIQSWQEAFSKRSSNGIIPKARPFVTVTYAQSIDGKIALLVDPNNNNNNNNNLQPKNDSDEYYDDDDDPPKIGQPLSLRSTTTTSSNFAISDPQSLRMTHALRSIHDAILVGGSTFSVDNPRLNNRLWQQQQQQQRDDEHSGISGKQKQPRPVVLDTHLHHIMRTLGRANNSIRANRRVIVCCSPEAAATVNARELPESMELLPCPLDDTTGKIDLGTMLTLLKEKYGIASIMVEGGASVLTSFYCQQQSKLIDCLCITISPKLLLWKGLASINAMAVPHNDDDLQTTENVILDQHDFETSKFLLLGSDSIFLGKLRPSLL